MNLILNLALRDTLDTSPPEAGPWKVSGTDLDPEPEEGRMPFGFLLKIETLSVSAVCSLKRYYFSLNDEDFITFRKQTSLWSVFLFLLYSCSFHHIWNNFFIHQQKQQQQ